MHISPYYSSTVAAAFNSLRDTYLFIRYCCLIHWYFKMHNLKCRFLMTRRTRPPLEQMNVDFAVTIMSILWIMPSQRKAWPDFMRRNLTMMQILKTKLTVKAPRWLVDHQPSFRFGQFHFQFLLSLQQLLDSFLSFLCNLHLCNI